MVADVAPCPISGSGAWLVHHDTRSARVTIAELFHPSHLVQAASVHEIRNRSIAISKCG
jgi:hypothetical protein